MPDERQFLELQFTVSTTRPGSLALYEPVTASEFVLVKAEQLEALEDRVIVLEERLSQLETLMEARNPATG